METRASYILVGSFVLAFLIGIVGAVVWLADLDLEAGVRTYDIYFEGTVSGLQVGNPVSYRGIPVGEVTDMRIDPNNVERVKVTVQVPDETPIKEDAVARLEYQGITGVRYVQIIGGTNEANLLTAKAGQSRPVIQSERSQLAQVFEEAPQLVADLRELVGRGSKILSDKNLKQVETALANLNQFSGELAGSSSDVAELLQSGSKTMVQLEKATRQAEQLIAAFADQGETLAELSVQTVKEGRDLLQETRHTVADVRPLIERADRTIAEYEILAKEVRGEIGPLAAKANTTLEKYDALAVETQATIGGLSKSADQTLAKYGALADRTDSRVEGISDKAQATLDRYGALADTVKPDVKEAARQASVTMKEFATIAADARKASDRIAAAAEEAELLIAENRAPISHFANSGLYEFTQLLAEMRVLTESLTRITTQIERDPARFFFGDAQKGFEVE